MTTMAAVDLGAQSGRVVLGRFDGEKLAVSETHRFSNVPVKTRGVLHWDVLRLFGDVLVGLHAAGKQGAVHSVGVDSWAVDFALLDRRGRLLRNPVHYRDARRAAAFDDVLATVPERELYERTGVQLLPINTVYELAALAAEDDPALEAAEILLLVPDLMHYWLGGRPVVERTNATTTQCLDAHDGNWAVDLLERLGLPVRMLPEIVPPGTPLGALDAGIAHDAGLGQATVVAPATHDTASAVAAVPFRDPRSAYVSAGTWSLVGLERDRPLIDDRTFEANLTNEGGVAGTTRLLRNVTGLWLLHECRQSWALEGREIGFAELVSLAMEAPALRSLVNPDDPRFAVPGDMPERIRASCAESGQDQPVEPGAVARCVLESLALGHAQAIRDLEEATGTTPPEVHMIGGGAQNELLCAWTADATGLPVLAGPAEAAAIGNLMVQAIALGELGSIDEARELVRASVELREYAPSDAGRWAEARARFYDLTATTRHEEVEA